MYAPLSSSRYAMMHVTSRPPDEASEAIWLGIITTLIFEIRQSQQRIEMRQITMALLHDALSFGCISSNLHTDIV